jgi:hypothetical protein
MKGKIGLGSILLQSLFRRISIGGTIYSIPNDFRRG